MGDSDDDDGDLAVYGTPLPPLEPGGGVKRTLSALAEERREYRKQKKAEREAERLDHWEPTAFVSSRKKRAQISSSKPEDFMDDKDFERFGIAPKVLQTRTEFMEREKGEHAEFSGIIPGFSMVCESLKPAKENFGRKLLRAMGWKEGQRIGPLIKKILSETSEEVEYAPHEESSIQLESRTGHSGLGYKGLSKSSILSQEFEFTKTADRIHMQGKQNRGQRQLGSLFSLGNDSDDEGDIYSSYELPTIDVIREPHEAESTSMFVLAKNPEKPPKRFPPPVLPSLFTPRHKPLHLLNAEETSSDDKKKPSRWSTASREEILSSESLVSSLTSSSGPTGEEVMTVASIQMPPVPSAPPKPKKSFKGISFIKGESYDPSGKIRSENEEFEVQNVSVDPSFASTESHDVEPEEIDFLEMPAAKPTPVLPRFVRAGEAVGSKEISQSDNAAKNKMYGALTRSTMPWMPDPLLCKRFRVRPPDKSAPVKIEWKANILRQTLFSTLPLQEDKKEQIESIPLPGDSDTTTLEGTDVPLKTDTTTGSDPESEEDHATDTNKEVPATDTGQQEEDMDIFKAIFNETSSEEEESEEEADPEESSKTEVTENERFLEKYPKFQPPNKSKLVEVASMTVIEPTATSSATIGPPSPHAEQKGGIFANVDPSIPQVKQRRGIFQNIDMQEVNLKWSTEPKIKGPATKGPSEEVKSITYEPILIPRAESSDDDDSYGPALPPGFSKSSSRSVPKKAKKDYHRKHKHKKHKSHKHKKSKKH